jgi:hypothetical protein
MSEMNRRSLLTALLGTCAAVGVVGVAATTAEAKPAVGGLALPETPVAKSEADDLLSPVWHRPWHRPGPYRRRRRWYRRRWIYY